MVIQLFTLFLLASSICLAQTAEQPTEQAAAPQALQLSQKDVANRILSDGYKSKEVNLSSQLTAYNLATVQSAYDFTLALDASQDLDKTKSLLSNAYIENDTNLISAKLSKALSTGTLLTFEGSNTRFSPNPNPNTNFGTAGPNPAQSNEMIGFTIQQSLWKNYLGSSDRAIINAAFKTEEASKISRADNLQNVVLEGVKQFWKTFVAQENFKEAIASRERYEKLVDVVKKKSSLGYANPGELAQIQAELETRNQNVKIQSTSYLAATDQLITLIKADPNSEIKFTVPEELPPLPKFSHISIEQLRFINAQKLKMESAELAMNSSQSKNHPDLSLVGKVYQNGVDQSADNAFNQMTSGSNPRLYVGFKYSQTFGSGIQQEEFINKRLQYEIENTKYERIKREVSDQVLDSQRKIQSTFAVVSSMKKQKELREKAALELQKAYNQGRTDITNMITALNQYFAVEVDYSRAIGDYHIALNEYAALKDDLIPDNFKGANP